MPEAIVTQAQEVLATATDLGTPTRIDQEVSMPKTAQPATTTNNESQLGALYLNSHINIPNSNISVCSSDPLVHENLKMLLNEKLNDKMYTAFRATFSNINWDSVSKTSPKLHAYNNEIAKFVDNINMKHGILLEFTVLEIPEVSHWVETFQVLMKPFNRKCTVYQCQ